MDTPKDFVGYNSVYVHVWLTTFTEYLKAGKGVDHATDAARAAVEAFKQFERGE
jgi:hypothetical protein